MAGGTTSVTSAVQLPEQPTSGFTRTQPLGGNGWSDPHSRTTCRIALASDAGGGTNIVIIRLDPRYTQLVAFCNISVSAAVADPITGRIELDCGGGEQWFQSLSMPLADTGATGDENNALWTPPNILCSADPNTDNTQPPRVRVIIPNVTAEALSLMIVCYNFDKRAREIAPIGYLMSSIPRSAALQS